MLENGRFEVRKRRVVVRRILEKEVMVMGDGLD
jgi:hypothetical protein